MTRFNAAKRLGPGLAVALGATVLASVAWAGPADVDTSFGGDGIVDPVPTPDAFHAVDLEVDPAGRIVVGGAIGPDLAVVRLLPDGGLDPSFSGDGIAYAGFSSSIWPGSMHLDGSKILVTGETQAADSDFAVARFEDDGTLDPGFSADGRQIAPVPNSARARASAATADHAVIIAGGVGDPSGTPPARPAFTRLEPDGDVDAGFGTGGTRVLDRTGLVFDLTASAGKLVAAIARDQSQDLTAARIDAVSGSSDPDFGSSGVATVDLGTDESSWALAVQPDGKVVLAGETNATGDGQAEWATARLLTDGTPDVSFSDDGRLTTQFGAFGFSYPTEVNLQPDGKIVTSGLSSACDYRPTVARYEPDGDLDPEFSADGRAIAPLHGDLITMAALQPDGRLVLARTQLTPVFSAAVIRLGTAAPDVETEWCPTDLAVTVDGPGSVLGPGIGCPPDCTDHTDPSSGAEPRVTLTAFPQPGYKVRWDGPCALTIHPSPFDPNCLLYRQGSTLEVTAHFVERVAPPVAEITRAPKRRTHRHRAKFRFHSDDPNATFRCALWGEGTDRAPGSYESCESPITYTGLPRGRKHFRVRALNPDADGRTDPARWNWKILRRRAGDRG